MYLLTYLISSIGCANFGPDWREGKGTGGGARHVCLLVLTILDGPGLANNQNWQILQDGPAYNGCVILIDTCTDKTQPNSITPFFTLPLYFRAAFYMMLPQHWITGSNC